MSEAAEMSAIEVRADAVSTLTVVAAWSWTPWVAMIVAKLASELAARLRRTRLGVARVPFVIVGGVPEKISFCVPVAVPKAPTVVVSVPITVKVPLFVAAPSVVNVSALVPAVGRAIET